MNCSLVLGRVCPARCRASLEIGAGRPHPFTVTAVEAQVTQVDILDIDLALEPLARRHRAANSFGVQLLGLLNRQTDALMDRLPENARGTVEQVTIAGLETAMTLASGTRAVVDHKSDRVNTAATAVSGVIGGFGGLATSLAELPITVTLLMRALQAIAREHGFDPDSMQSRKDCLLAFAAEGPLRSVEQGVDLNFLAARSTLNGVNVYIGIGLIAPKLAAVLGRKLAAQTIPVFGAATAAATNYAYTGYYQNMAHVVFGLRRLSEDTGVDFADLAVRLREKADVPVLQAKAS